MIYRLSSSYKQIDSPLPKTRPFRVSIFWNSIFFDFIVRPEISVPSAATAIEGHNVDIYFIVTAANPAANVTWRGPPNTILSSGPQLTLSSVNRNQGGAYTCTASNGISPNATKATNL